MNSQGVTKEEGRAFCLRARNKKDCECCSDGKELIG